ncbi:hypothetical protein [Paenibacillus polymyxa]|nr:hypothetical protein [Paenibacillus polymyxa]MDU8674262.1 hypothetical protein [Paenibacillus polymyxa]MDU8699170.1 hypothetical protein [Paenibacillus polymyxa]QOH60363.1 hypothetical protein DI243_02605 [Paenibacillus polymyxa]URJ53842.3 hypothetical protein MF623_003154 [Paenibacillus polymyxa]URJ68351.1 hypothetical protein MF624_003137 [Paenibacillus polymyxa]
MEVIDPESGKHGMLSILKYFLIAYLVTDLNEYEGLDELTQYCTSSHDTEVEIPVRVSNLRGQKWPEINKDSMLLAGDDIFVFSKPRIKMLKKRKG